MLGFLSKKSKGASRKGQADLTGCFGKMPLHADFIRHNVVSRESVALVNWLQEGVGEVQRRGKEEYKETLDNFGAISFVMIGSENDRTVVGTISPSRDKSGRKYPVATFSTVAEPLFLTMPATVPCVYDDFLKKAHGLAGGTRSELSLQDFCADVDRLARTGDELSRRTLLEKEIGLIKTMTVGEFWAGSFPGRTRENREEVIFALYKALKKVIQRSSSRTSWGIRFPLPASGDPSPTLLFWLQMVESILEERMVRFNYFWNQASAEMEASLVVFFRPVTVSCFSALISPGDDDGLILDLSKALGDPSVARNVRDLQHMLDNDSTSMLDLLYNAGRGEMLQ
ncbi:MAG: type VI secretion system-associated protein TagF [Thermodesulfobacteriota bacterium]